MDAVDEEASKVFVDGVTPNLGRLNVDRGGKDMMHLYFPKYSPTY